LGFFTRHNYSTQLLKQIVKCRFGGSRGIYGLSRAFGGAFIPGVQGKPVAKIGPFRVRIFLCLALRAAGGEAKAAVFA